MKRIFIIAIATLSAALCAQAQPTAKDSDNHIVILHTNDSHSGILPVDNGENAGCGGYARREVYINKVKAENKNVILMDAGDFSQGSPFFNLYKGDTETELLNALNYDVVTIGNHEFDNGQEELARRIKNSNFPYVCANYNFTKSSLGTLLKPYVIIEKAGKRFGVFGLLTNIMNVVAKKFQDGMEYNDYIQVGNRVAEELRDKEKCDVVIALTHIGYHDDCKLAENSSNIDIIIGGHSHTTIKEKTVIKNLNGKEVVVVQDGEKGEFVGRLDLWF